MLDIDGNSKITKREIYRRFTGDSVMVNAIVQGSPCLKYLQQPKTWGKAFESMDTNEDGVLSFDEFIRYCAIEFQKTQREGSSSPIAARYGPGSSTSLNEKDTEDDTFTPALTPADAFGPSSVDDDGLL